MTLMRHSADSLSCGGAEFAVCLGGGALTQVSPNLLLVDDGAAVGVPGEGLRHDTRLRYVLGVVLLAALYYGSARIGYELEFAGPVAAIVWLPVGVAIAFLYLGGLRFWPGVLAGDLLANNYTALPLGGALGQTFGNMVEVVLAVVMLGPRTSLLESVRGVGRTLAALAAGTAASATIGTLSLIASGVIERGHGFEVWRTWWLGDLSGALVVVPLAVAWYPIRRPLRIERAGEAAALFAGTVVLSELIFRKDQPLTYLVFPALIWAALRFGQRGATLAVATVVSVAVWNTAHLFGPFAYESVTRSVLAAQLFIAVSALSTLCLAAVVSERRRAAESLTASRARLIHAADSERRQLEQNLHDGAQQRLAVARYALKRARDSVVGSPPTAAELLDDADAQLELAVDELRELAHGIHPPTLTRLGLARAIESFADHSSVPIDLVALPNGRFDEVAEATAYYVVAEAVTNAQRHARASTIRVVVEADGATLRVEVSDDGIGGADETAGAGLEGLRDRVEAVAGSFQVESASLGGTRVVAIVPAAPAD